MAVDFPPSDDKDLIARGGLLPGEFNRLMQTARHLSALGQNPVAIAAGHDQICAVGQWLARQALPGFAPHDDGVAGGQVFEAFQVAGQMPEQLVAAPDLAAGSMGDNGGDHTAMGILMAGWHR
ncbi:hypothetical protein QPK87_15870 [Kamptonema cortianum]|nr:hypothetical protein [Kamptonema cortianum]